MFTFRLGQDPTEHPPASRSPSLPCHLTAAGSLSDLRWSNFADSQAQVQRFYEPEGYTMAWTQNGVITNRAEAIIEMLRAAEIKGLDPDDCDAQRWPARLERLRGSPSLEDTTRFDLALTVSLMRYLSDLRMGRVNPGWFDATRDVEQGKYDLARLVRRLASSAGDVQAAAAEIEPPFEGYRRTQKVLQSYLAIAHDDDGEPLPATGNVIEPGSLYSGAPQLVRLLRRLGDLPEHISCSDAGEYDSALVEAVKRFQARHGLKPDGRVGKATQRELNTPLSRRVRQLQLTLERWRWVPHRFSQPPIVVNIPEFRLRAFNESYKPELELNVVVGRAFRHQTPVFAGELKYVVFRPYWNVPRSIALAELLPKLARSRFYLAKNGYQVVNAQNRVVTSGAVDDLVLAQLYSGRLSIRQVPGAQNALGLVKFLFPNEHSVHLHGTPAIDLFARSRRDFSHGCIRVEHPELLASWVLRDEQQWTPDRIADAMHGSKTIEVNLKHPIPVLIVYATAVVLPSGEVRFFEDIYGQDARLEELLAESRPYGNWRLTSSQYGPHPRH